MTGQQPDQAQPPEGGRDNGLSAAYFVPLRDIDPRVAPVVLEALREAAIAAYVMPSPGNRGAYGDIHLPPSPAERVWVDGQLRSDADVVVSAVLADVGPGAPGASSGPGGSGAAAAVGAEQHSGSDQHDATAAGRDGEGRSPDARELDERAIFEAIVAGFDGEAGVRTWPDAEDLPRDTATAPSGREARDDASPIVEEAAAEDADDALPAHVQAILDEHFVPAPPPPLPRPNGATALALTGIVGGLGVLLADGLLQLGLDNGILFIAALCALIGFGTLVMRMRDERGDDDDGAVV